jgi:glycosyltransferase involved in cell wall biosynthesis
LVTPKISVILTAFNSEDFIRRSIDSVLNQTYKNYELIVVNDGSMDKTEEIVSTIYPDVKLIKKTNGGPSSARNAGIGLAKGVYIAFLDADDYWFPDKLKKQIGVFEEDTYVNIVATNMFNVKDSERIGIKFDPSKIFMNKKSEGIVENYIRNAPRYSFHPPSALMVSKKLFEKYGLYDENLKAVEDSEIVLRWVMNGEKIYFIDDPLVGYEVGNPDSLTKNVVDWSKNHFKYWIDYLHKSTNRADYYVFSQMVNKTLLLSCIRSVVLAGHNKHAKYLLFKYKSDLFSLLWFYSLLLTFLPLHEIKVFYKKLVK